MSFVHVPDSWRSEQYLAGFKEYTEPGQGAWHACHPEAVVGEQRRYRARCGLRWCLMPEETALFVGQSNRCRRCASLLNEDERKHEGVDLEHRAIALLRTARVHGSPGATTILLQMDTVADKDDLVACIEYLTQRH